MKALHDIPFQRKLRVVILGTCSVALIVACTALFAFQYFFFRRDFEADLAAVSEMVATNSTAALSFSDEAAAREILETLRPKRYILGGSMLLKDGTPLATMGDHALPPLEARPDTPKLWEWQGQHYFSRPIIEDGEIVGALILKPDYRGKSAELFRLYASILLVVLTISFLVAAVISWRLERVILGPIQYLAAVTRKISGRDDYSLRAQKFVEDEIGSFTDSFNSMLEQIEQRDQELRHEIAERSRAEEELQALHRQLVDASRQAGMAEVATGVLHNVGNVLNSVNVSATLIADKLSSSKLGNLQRATHLLAEQNGGLSDFLTHDPKGRVLPGYLRDVTTHIARERTEALEEITLLAKNIEHIKDIVALQQNYARVAGFIETLSIESLIEDALRMNVASFERHGVKVVRDYSPIPDCAVDKHKVLQILINLLRNAKYAMDEAEPPVKTLRVTLRRQSETEAVVLVKDNGVGIPPENLTRIFSHGFTTRRDGHGFGLHSSALAAQQMGGDLHAESEGVGKGATFVLVLPFAPTAPPS